LWDLEVSLHSPAEFLYLREGPCIVLLDRRSQNLAFAVEENERWDHPTQADTHDGCCANLSLR
jgi:hypothetical protein